MIQNAPATISTQQSGSTVGNDNPSTVTSATSKSRFLDRDWYVNIPIPKPVQSAFLVKRLHSITGLFFILFLVEHLLTNSEATFFIGEDGISFIRSVNLLQSLPYLEGIEIFFLGVPIGIHILLGLVSLVSTMYNSFRSDGSTPSLPHYSRNVAFTFQRLTALFLMVGVLAHVVSMRCINKPQKIEMSNQFYLNVSPDQGLLTVCPRLGVTLLTKESKGLLLQRLQKKMGFLKRSVSANLPQPILNKMMYETGRVESKISFISQQQPSDASWTAIAPDFGTACLLLVRDSFKSWYLCTLYAFFVLMATFHAGNGLWTFAITWGIAQNEQGRRLVRVFSLFLIALFSFWGLSSIFGTYWINLHH
jgi:succinate dehydrogenase / fumarate reductase, cytochrome b subunit